MNLKGKNVIVTGGSLGIGKETAKALVEKGANVLITGRSEDRLHKAKLYCSAETIAVSYTHLTLPTMFEV